MKHIAAFLVLISFVTSSLAIEEEGKEWAIATATRPSDGRVIVFRFLQKHEPSFDRSKFPVKATLTWLYNSSSGMPSVPERESMDKFEDRFARLLETGSIASLALVRTGENLRQWTFYTISESLFRSKLDQALREEARPPIELSLATEPNWATYEQFVRGVRE